MVFWLGFAQLAFGYVKNLYHKAVVYNSARQGRQTPRGIVIAKVLQHMHTIYILITQSIFMLEM